MELNHHQARTFSHLELLAKQAVEGFITGLHKSPFHGFSVEFAEHRIYNSGESTRHIDWKLYGRTDKLFVKKYEEETNLRCQVVIDHSSSMHFPLEPGKISKLEFSVNAAACLVYLLGGQRDAIGLSVFSSEMEVHTQAKSSLRHRKLLFHELEKLLENKEEKTGTKTNTSGALHEIAEKLPRRSLVVLFSDMFTGEGRDSDEIFSALQHLRHNKHEVVLFHVVEKKRELDFGFEERPLLFVDIESGEKIKAHPNEIKKAYLESIEQFEKDLKTRCASYRIDFIPSDIEEGYNQVLLNYLVKREKLG